LFWNTKVRQNKMLPACELNTHLWLPSTIINTLISLSGKPIPHNAENISHAHLERFVHDTSRVKTAAMTTPLY
jgi:hypothetical protein